MLVEVDSEYKIYSERLRVLEKQFYEDTDPTVSGSICRHSAAIREKSSSLKKLGNV